MDAFRLDAAPEQLTAPGIFHINRQRALQLRVHAAVPSAPAAPAATVVRRAISNRCIRTPPVAGPAEVAVFHLETSPRDDIHVRILIDAPHPATLELSGNCGIRALAHE